MKAWESVGVVVIIVVFLLFNFYVVRELALLRADVTNINTALSELRRESYRVADLQVSNAELMGNVSNVDSQMDILAAFVLGMNDEIDLLMNSSIGPDGRVVIITKRPTGTPFYNIPDSMKEIQNLSEGNDEWREWCFNTTSGNELCYRKVE